MVEETIAPEDREVLTAAATAYAGRGRYILRVEGHTGFQKTFIVDGIAFHHLSKMIDNSIAEGLGDLEHGLSASVTDE